MQGLFPIAIGAGSTPGGPTKGKSLSDPLFHFNPFMPVVYILYSQNTSRFYTGMTTLSIQDRLQGHIEKYYQNKHTAKINDWKVFLTIECDSIKQAHAIEAHIKKMKSSTYIRNLEKHPEMVEKLIEKYKNS